MQIRQQQISTFNGENHDPIVLTSLLQQLNYSIDQCCSELERGELKIPEIKVKSSQRTKRTASHDNTCYNPIWLIKEEKRRIIQRHNKEYQTFLPSFVWENKEPMQPKPRCKPLAPLKGTINKPQILLPKEIRKNPLNQRKRIYESLIYKEGLCNLINKGLIDKHIDVSPAFESSLMLM